MIALNDERCSPKLTSHVRAFLGIALLGSLASASAAELVVRDITADFSIRPRNFDFSLTTGGSTIEGSDGFSAATGLEAGGRYSFSRPGDAFGLIVGLDLGFNGMVDSDGTLGALLLHPCVGAGWAITDRWELSLLTGYAIGQATLDLDASNAAPSLSATGAYHALDFGCTVGWRLSRNWLLTGTLGYVTGSYDLSGDAGSTNADITLDVAGPYLAFGVAWRLSTNPVRLE